LLLSAVAVVALTACSTVTGTGSPEAAATVGGESIPITTVEQRFEQAKANPQVAQQLQGDESGQFESQVQSQILSQLILAEIVGQWADELGIEATQAELDEERESVIEQLGGEEQFQQAVEQAGLSEDQVDDQLRQQVLQTKIAEEVGAGDEVTDAQVEDFYQQNKDARFGERADARHILVKGRAEAEKIKQQLDDGADFAELAQENSTDPGSKENGGELGEVTSGQTVPAFEEAVFGAEEGEIVGPVKTQFGFHVIQVTGKSPAQTLEESREEIETELAQSTQNEGLQQALMERAREAEVDVNPRFGTWDPETGTVTPEEPLGAASEAGGSEPAAAPSEAVPSEALPSEQTSE
jgi:parvulin-like peptidyl-prolyl isomerase